ncbi:hypothetical protein L2E82_16573 [Cichorium intybus]|uniref:Uncharacterized protein n=1 Tax=Cichorium intybus TaxID=13427 RepID=A0ACB9F6F4_CICIN|nr:hypothetical protein L2E82_16573 [Cichorium intybus]
MAECVLPTAPPLPPLSSTPPTLLPPIDSPFSLYAGDLHPNVTETDLHILFSTIGPLHGVHLCRDRFSRKSRCYAFVNFYLPFHDIHLIRFNNGASKGIASVCFLDSGKAKRVMKNLNGCCYRGKYMNVTFALSKEEYTRRMQALFPFAFLCKVPNLERYLETKVQKEDQVMKQALVMEVLLYKILKLPTD